MDSLLVEACQTARARLLAARDAGAAWWTGTLSDSALSTALAVSALGHAPVPAPGDTDRIRRGLDWLRATQLADGSWGDTPVSPGNLSATAIAWATLRELSVRPETGRDTPGHLRASIARAQDWMQRQPAVGGPAPFDGRWLVDAITTIYGDDRTFAVPILAHLAWCGALGPAPAAWTAIPPLPFLLVLLPRALFATLRLQVVSYAIPALIAVGLARHVGRARATARRVWAAPLMPALLRRLERLQPGHGGYLDAAPLTAFVALGLGAAGQGAHPVAEKCRSFLRGGQRPNGAWPIDTQLSGWLTALAVRALTVETADDFPRQAVAARLFAAQHRVRHSFTGAAPGGWGWSDRPGAVPDADDTAAALIALRGLGTPMNDAVRDGLLWLLNLQNRDGGIPTFCRGWGRLPFDRSCPDLTAHACAAWSAWSAMAGRRLHHRLDTACRRAQDYLVRQQRDDGSWHPLWFGNAGRADAANPTIGTARVLSALRPRASPRGGIAAARQRGEQWLLAAQQDDGSWGGDARLPPSIEETAWGVIALADPGAPADVREAALRGARWLAERLQADALAPSPIGLYFSRLWYAEALYPVIWTAEALARARTIKTRRRKCC